MNLEKSDTADNVPVVRNGTQRNDIIYLQMYSCCCTKASLIDWRVDILQSESAFKYAAASTSMKYMA